MPDVIELTQNLIRCASVTPEDAGAQGVLRNRLEAAGFKCFSLPFGEGEDRIENLFARIGTSAPHLCYGGHTDVVPTGPVEQWTNDPFDPVIKDGILYGRGASDMKGSVAAFTCAAISYVEKYGAPENGSISLLITGDEEALAINGTIKVLDWMKDNGHTPDMALVGEPTNPDHIGQEIKIGRRGSLNGHLTVTGKQGHVAYQHLADNPVPRMIAMLDILAKHEFDAGNEYFAPTNLEITTVDVGNTATNIIPETATATFNIRFNDNWSSDMLKLIITELLNSVCEDYVLEFEGNAESFITKPSEWSKNVADAVEEISEKRPDYTTTGGTSNAAQSTKPFIKLMNVPQYQIYRI
jgi:succinyl-diaminopimelate desuccinylase